MYFFPKKVAIVLRHVVVMPVRIATPAGEIVLDNAQSVCTNSKATGENIWGTHF
jgi:hypothetical protein